ncbi:hypothetical protein ACFWPJ_27030, partial [Nocardia sp. NPDC058497]
EMAETVVTGALNVRSNYFKHVASPELDFPLVPTTAKEATGGGSAGPGAMTPKWRAADTVALVDGYTLTDADGQPTSTVHDVRVAIEGGFAHISVDGSALVQVVSAPAVALITYRHES